MEMSLKDFLKEFFVEDSLQDFLASRKNRKWYYGSDGYSVVIWSFTWTSEGLIYDEYVVDPANELYEDLCLLADTEYPDVIAEKMTKREIFWGKGPEKNANWISRVRVYITDYVVKCI